MLGALDDLLVEPKEGMYLRRVLEISQRCCRSNEQPISMRSSCEAGRLLEQATCQPRA